MWRNEISLCRRIESHTELIHRDPLSNSREIEIDIIIDSIFTSMRFEQVNNEFVDQRV